MIQKITETREIVKTNETVTIAEIRKCDICKKVISDSRKKINPYRITVNHYWRTTMGHYDWGNDSNDSIVQKDVCSKECLQKVFNVYCRECGNKGDSMYLEISHTYDNELLNEDNYKE